MLNTGVLLEIFNEHSSAAILVSLGVSIIIALSGVLPSLFVTGANILFFGAAKGLIISILGETIGGYITFKIYRLGIRKHAENIRGRYRLLDELMDSEGKKAGMLIFEGRLIPFIPSGFVTLAAALSRVDGIIFTTATFTGKIPSIVLEGIVSYDIINISENYVRLIITLIALAMIYFTLCKGKKV